MTTVRIDRRSSLVGVVVGPLLDFPPRHQPAMLATLLASLPALRNGVGSGLTPLRSPSSTARAATPVMQYGGDAMSQSGQYGQQGYGQQGMPNMPLPPASQRYAAPPLMYVPPPQQPRMRLPPASERYAAPPLEYYAYYGQLQQQPQQEGFQQIASRWQSGVESFRDGVGHRSAR